MPTSAQQKSSINLIPRKTLAGSASFLQKSLRYVKFSLITLNLILIVGLFFEALLAVSFTTSYSKVKSSLDLINQSQPLENSVDEITSRLKLIKTIEAQNINSLVVKSFSNLIPVELKVTELRVESGKLILKGDTLDIRVLRSLAQVFKTSTQFSNFSITQIVPPSSNFAFYTITGMASINTTAGVN